MGWSGTAARLGVAAWTCSILALACTVEDAPLAGKACSEEDQVCAVGWVCNKKTNTCVDESNLVCVAARDCQLVETACEERACGDDGLCSLIPRAERPQTEGDCRTRTCADDGSESETNDDADVFDDGEPCTIDACTSGARSHELAAIGARCPTGVCNAEGRCVPAGCIDGAMNGGESGIDCGGECPACGAPACDDGVENGSETDVDCGGGTCPPCEDGAGCHEDIDCLRGKCASGGFCAGPCDDEQLDAEAGESDVDCGGGGCPKCLSGLLCQEADDCKSGYCCEAGDVMRCYEHPCPPP